MTETAVQEETVATESDTPQESSVASLADIHKLLHDDTPAAEEPQEEVKEEPTEHETTKEDPQETEDQEETQEPANRKRSKLDEIKFLREERRNKDTELETLRLQLQQSEDARAKLAAMAAGTAEQEEEKEYIDDALAEDVKELKAQLAEKDKATETKEAIASQHQQGVMAYGEDYKMAHQVVVASEAQRISRELSYMGQEATPEQIQQAAVARIREAELSLLQSGKNVASYTWNRAQDIAKQYAPKAEAKPAKPKLNMENIEKARKEAGASTIAKANVTGKPSSVKGYFEQFAEEDKQGSGF